MKQKIQMKQNKQLMKFKSKKMTFNMIKFKKILIIKLIYSNQTRNSY